MIDSPYLTIEEAAAYLRVDEKTLRRHIMRLIAPLSIGRRKFYTTEMLDRGAMHLSGHVLLTTADHYVRGREDLAREALSALGSRGVLGEGDITMLSAKEGSRTHTRVTPLEPESSESGQLLNTYKSPKGPEDPEPPTEGPSFRGPPETLVEASGYLALLRTQWDALDDSLASELLGEGGDG